MNINTNSTGTRETAIDGATYLYALDNAGDATIVRCSADCASLRIPDSIEGHEVTALAGSSFAKLKHVAEIACPETVGYIGHHAFEQCRSLRRLVFPEGLGTFDPEWLTGCTSIEDLSLPGMAPSIPRGLFGTMALKSLHIGKGTLSIDIPHGQPLDLETLAVDERNPLLSTDGIALYGGGGTQLIALARRQESYRIADGCAEILPYAFAYHDELAEAALPDTLRSIGDLAFLDSGIRRFSAPPALSRIGRRAFMGCALLREVKLNVGLLEIGEGAFARTRLNDAIEVPATVTQLGSSIAGFPEELEAKPALIKLAPGNAVLVIDEQGLVYLRGKTGLVLHDASYFTGSHACLRPGTVKIGDGAFKRHRFVQWVTVPEGATAIGDGAFAQCSMLTRADLPSTLERIGDEAFFATSLDTIHVPARCVHIGQRALDTTARRRAAVRGGVHHVTLSSMRSATVDEDNPVFYVSNGLLCRRRADGSGEAEAVRYVGPDVHVRIPPEATSIGSHAFAGVTGVESLYIHKRVRSIGTAALLPTEPFGKIAVELDEPELGHPSVEIELPAGDTGVNILRSALYREISPRTLMESYDATVPHLPNLYERYRKMVERLADPVMLADWAERVYRRDLALDARRACLILADHNDTRALERLVDLELTDADTLSSVIDQLAGNVRTVTATARLLELRRRRFGQSAVDYEL